MKKLLMGIGALGVWSLLSTTTATANCDRPSVSVVRVSVYPGTEPSFIFYRDTALSPFFWACTTNDAKLLAAAMDAQNGLTKAFIRGDVASCPTTSDASGGRGAGHCMQVIVNP